VKVPAAGPATDLVTQMRAVQAERVPGAPADAGSASSAMPEAKPAPARAKRARPKNARERAAHHLGVKKALWIPALGVGVLCFLASGAAFGLALRSALTRSPLEIRQGTFGPVFTDERGDHRELVFAPDGRAWLIEKDAERLEWEDNRPRPMAGDFTLKAIPAGSDPNAVRFAEDIRLSRHKGFGNVVFGGILAVLGPLLVILSLWMRRDVRLVAEAEKAKTAEQVEKVKKAEKAEKTTESA
jgi:hypothetical protein